MSTLIIIGYLLAASVAFIVICHFQGLPDGYDDDITAVAVGQTALTDSKTVSQII